MTGISRQQIHNVLRALLKDEKIIRRGRAPLSYYSLKRAETHSSETILDLSTVDTETLEKDFVLIKREGREVGGARAVCDYAQEFNVDPQQVAEQFLTARSQQLQELSATDSGAADQHELLKEKTQVESGLVDRYNFADFTSVGTHGLTATAKKLRIAKASNNGVLQMELFRSVERQIHEYITDYGIDAVAFMPGSSTQGKSFMMRWKEQLDLPLPHVNLVRAVTDIQAPQDTISLHSDRLAYAESTLVVAEHRHYQHILLLDDELLSGKSVSHAAKRIHDAAITDRVSVYTITFERKLLSDK